MSNPGAQPELSNSPVGLQQPQQSSTQVESNQPQTEAPSNIPTKVRDPNKPPKDPNKIPDPNKPPKDPNKVEPIIQQQPLPTEQQINNVKPEEEVQKPPITNPPSKVRDPNKLPKDPYKIRDPNKPPKDLNKVQQTPQLLQEQSPDKQDPSIPRYMQDIHNVKPDDEVEKPAITNPPSKVRDPNKPPKDPNKIRDPSKPPKTVTLPIAQSGSQSTVPVQNQSQVETQPLKSPLAQSPNQQPNPQHVDETLNSKQPTSELSEKTSEQLPQQPSQKSPVQATQQVSNPQNQTEQPIKQTDPQPQSQTPGKQISQTTQPPNQQPAQNPTQPAQNPPSQPTQAPTQQPTQQPAQKPNQPPAEKPTQPPAEKPTQQPTQQSTLQPAQQPAQQPSEQQKPILQKTPLASQQPQQFQQPPPQTPPQNSTQQISIASQPNPADQSQPAKPIQPANQQKEASDSQLNNQQQVASDSGPQITSKIRDPNKPPKDPNKVRDPNKPPKTTTLQPQVADESQNPIQFDGVESTNSKENPTTTNPKVSESSNQNVSQKQSVNSNDDEKDNQEPDGLVNEKKETKSTTQATSQGRQTETPKEVDRPKESDSQTNFSQQEPKKQDSSYWDDRNNQSEDVQDRMNQNQYEGQQERQDRYSDKPIPRSRQYVKQGSVEVRMNDSHHSQSDLKPQPKVPEKEQIKILIAKYQLQYENSDNDFERKALESTLQQLRAKLKTLEYAEKSSPKRIVDQPKPQLNPREQIRANLNEIYQFYAKQTFMNGRSVTFDKLMHVQNVLTMVKFMYFCRDFEVINLGFELQQIVDLLTKQGLEVTVLSPIKEPKKHSKFIVPRKQVTDKTTLVELFKKCSANNTELTFIEFELSISKIANFLYQPLLDQIETKQDKPTALILFLLYLQIQKPAEYRKKMAFVGVPFAMKDRPPEKITYDRIKTVKPKAKPAGPASPPKAVLKVEDDPPEAVLAAKQPRLREPVTWDHLHKQKVEEVNNDFNPQDLLQDMDLSDQEDQIYLQEYNLKQKDPLAQPPQRKPQSLEPSNRAGSAQRKPEPGVVATYAYKGDVAARDNSASRNPQRISQETSARAQQIDLQQQKREQDIYQSLLKNQNSRVQKVSKKMI